MSCKKYKVILPKYCPNTYSFMVGSDQSWFHSPSGLEENSSGLSLFSEEGAWGSLHTRITELPALTVRTPRQRRGRKQRWQGQTSRSQVLPSTAPFFLVLLFPSERGLENFFSPSAPSRTLSRVPSTEVFNAWRRWTPPSPGSHLSCHPSLGTDGRQDGAAMCH